MHTRTVCHVLGAAFFLSMLLSVSSVHAVDVQLTWSAPTANVDGSPLTDLAGYKIYYGQTSGNYDTVIDTGNVTSVTLADLSGGQTYYFAATAYDFSGNESAFSNELRTTLPNTGTVILTANFQASPVSGPAPRTVTFTDGSSGNITAWNWAFGDGATSSQQSPSHTYTTPGSYTVSLTVTDAHSLDTATQTLTITEPPANGTLTLYVAYDSRATRYPDWLTSSYTPTGQTIDTSDVPLTVWRRDVAPGALTLPGNTNGNPQEAGSNYIVLLEWHGTGTISTVNPSTYQLSNLHVGDTYYTDRSYTIVSMPPNLEGLLGIKTANDDKTNSTPSLVSFTAIVQSSQVPAAAPVALDDTITTPEDTPVTTANVLANDTDANGDLLSISGFTQASNGSVTHHGSGTFTYKPVADFNGTDAFTYTVSNTGGLTATGSVLVTITPVNDTPIAAVDAASTEAEQPVTVAVLANDRDLDGDSLAVATVTQGGNGTVVRNADHTVTYTPNAQFSGTDTFTYSVDDGNGGTSTGTVTVAVAAAFTMVWLEAEDGALFFPMDIGVDELASSGQYVWVPDGHESVLEPSQSSGIAHYTFSVPKADTYVIWGRLSPNAAGMGSFFLTVTGGDAVVEAGEPGSVTDINPQSYEAASLHTGDTYYTDRDYRITAMPADFDGFTVIKTANHDKTNTDAERLAFTLTQNATLYVAYDSRATRFPDWLTASYTNTGLMLNTTDVPLVVWQREVTAGPTIVPGNQYGNPQGTASNYLVLVNFHETGPGGPAHGDEKERIWQLPAQAHSQTTGAVTEVSPQPYEVGVLHTGDTYYTDRSYRITDMPANLQGLAVIKTANNDKTNTEAAFLTFTVAQNATLYVAYDSRTTHYPDWLTAAFSQTGQTIATSDVPLTVWRQEVAAGAVTLPGNQHGNPQGVGSNYLVLVDFQGQEAAQPWVWDQAARETMPVFFLETGVYTLTIKHREAGTKIDRLLVTNNLDYMPHQLGEF